jgi:hypothetical protein
MKINFPKLKFKNEHFIFLLPVFFVLHGFTENYHFISAVDCLLLLIRYFIVAGIISLLLFLALRSWRKAAVFTFLIMCFHFFFGTIHDSLKSWIPNSLLVKYFFILPFAILLFILLFFYFRKTTRYFHRFIKYINILLVTLILIDSVELIFKINNSNKRTISNPIGFTGCDTCNKPDIYFIIADEYAGQRELADVFHFDNSAFISALKEKGFRIINNSFSNYNYTPFCMASTLSMNYLMSIEGRNSSKKDRRICYQLINQNPVIELLKDQGYVFKNLSVFQFNDDLPIETSPFFLTGKDLLTSQTFLSRLDRDIRFNLVTKYKIRSEMQTLANTELNSIRSIYNHTLEEVTKDSKQPRFIYIHLMMPHYPYFFDRNGKMNPVDKLMEGQQVLQKEYIEYLQYSNGQFLKLIDYILSNSKKLPIIIFMGDHGFRHFTDNIDHKYYYNNLNSIYLPSQNYKGFSDSLSSVNQFRVLFNNQFNQHLPLLKNSTIFLQE